MSKREIDKAIVECESCELHMLEANDNSLQEENGYGKLVGKEGRQSNDIMIVGLNPSGARFEGLKHPFDANMSSTVYNAGTGFMKMLRHIGIYDHCYVTNLVKCSTFDNTVSNDDFNNCKKHFELELEYAKPKLILACGNQVYEFLTTYYNNTEASIKKIYHPSYCLSYNRINEDQYLKHIANIVVEFAEKGK